MNKVTFKGLSLGIVIGIAICVLIYSTIAINFSSNESSTKTINQINSDANEPLYWVAPMDANFKRDKPGKSPMGMDLVPVYAVNNSEDSPGTVKIEPSIVQNLGVKTAKIKKILPSQIIRTFGEVQYAQDNISHVHPRVEGWINKLYVHTQGDAIEKGAPLYSLYSPELVNAQEEYLIALGQNNKALVKAARSRLLALNIPETFINNLNKTREVQNNITFYASQSGVVIELNVQEGFYVKPATTMLAIASLDSVWVLAEIYAADLSKIRVGDTASIQFDHRPELSTDATLQYIYPDVNSTTRTTSARFELPNPRLALKPNMYATVEIQHQANKPILVVPNSAVIRTGVQNRVVLALGEGRYKSIELHLGASYNDVVEVLSGLKENDTVVTSAQFLLDSESSISSDFLRIANEVDKSEDPDSSVLMKEIKMNDNSEHEEESAEQISAWTEAKVNELMHDNLIVNLTHGPLDAFNMMGMTMNFEVANHIDFTQFIVGQTVHVEIVKGNSGMYKINTVHFMKSNAEHAGEQP